MPLRGHVCAQSTNVMPQGFETVSIGMTSNQLHQAHPAVQWPDGSFPSAEALELLTTNAFFDFVGYNFFAGGGLSDVQLFPAMHKAQRRGVLPGFLKGCIQKYGTNYEMRVTGGSTNGITPRVALLRWTSSNVVVVASFVSDANQTAYKNAYGEDIGLLPYKLRIYHQDAININGGTNFLDDITISYPANQDATGRAFTNFPSFLDSYTGQVWQ